MSEMTGAPAGGNSDFLVALDLDPTPLTRKLSSVDNDIKRHIRKWRDYLTTQMASIVPDGGDQKTQQAQQKVKKTTSDLKTALALATSEGTSAIAAFSQAELAATAVAQKAEGTFKAFAKLMSGLETKSTAVATQLGEITDRLNGVKSNVATGGGGGGSTSGGGGGGGRGSKVSIEDRLQARLNVIAANQETRQSMQSLESKKLLAEQSGLSASMNAIVRARESAALKGKALDQQYIDRLGVMKTRMEELRVAILEKQKAERVSTDSAVKGAEEQLSVFGRLKNALSQASQQRDFLRKQQGSNLQMTAGQWDSLTFLGKFSAIGGAALKATTGIEEGMGRIIPKVLTWATATAVVYGSIRQIRNLMMEISKLDVGRAGLARIYRGTDMSSEEASNVLTASASRMAGAYGVSIVDIQTQMKDYARQGRDVYEINKLMTGSLLLQKAAEMGAADAARTTTAVMKQYGLTVDETLTYVDRLNQLENTTAARAKDIAEAVARTGTAAKNAGVELSQLAAISAVQIETTGRKGTEIGRGLRTLFTRMYSEQAKAALRKDAEIEVNLQKGGLLGSWDVLSKLAEKWSDLTEQQRKHLAITVAGKDRVNEFMITMQNWQKVLAAVTSEQMSANSAAIEAARLQDTVTGKMEQLRQKISALLVAPGMSGGLTNTLKDALDWLKDRIDWAQNIDPNWAKTIIAGLIGIAAALGALKIGGIIGGAVAAAGFATGGALIGPLAALVAGVGSVIGVMRALNRERTGKFDDIARGIARMSESTASLANRALGLRSFRDEIVYVEKKLVALSKSNASIEEKEKRRRALIDGLRGSLEQLKALEDKLNIPIKERISNEIRLAEVRNAGLAESIRLTRTFIAVTAKAEPVARMDASKSAVEQIMAGRLARDAAYKRLAGINALIEAGVASDKRSLLKGLNFDEEASRKAWRRKYAQDIESGKQALDKSLQSIESGKEVQSMLFAPPPTPPAPGEPPPIKEKASRGGGVSTPEIPSLPMPSRREFPKSDFEEFYGDTTFTPAQLKDFLALVKSRAEALSRERSSQLESAFTAASIGSNAIKALWWAMEQEDVAWRNISDAKGELAETRVAGAESAAPLDPTNKEQVSKESKRAAEATRAATRSKNDAIRAYNERVQETDELLKMMHGNALVEARALIQLRSAVLQNRADVAKGGGLMVGGVSPFGISASPEAVKKATKEVSDLFEQRSQVLSGLAMVGRKLFEGAFSPEAVAESQRELVRLGAEADAVDALERTLGAPSSRSLTSRLLATHKQQLDAAKAMLESAQSLDELVEWIEGSDAFDIPITEATIEAEANYVESIVKRVAGERAQGGLFRLMRHLGFGDREGGLRDLRKAAEVAFAASTKLSLAQHQLDMGLAQGGSSGPMSEAALDALEKKRNEAQKVLDKANKRLWSAQQSVRDQSISTMIKDSKDLAKILTEEANYLETGLLIDALRAEAGLADSDARMVEAFKAQADALQAVLDKNTTDWIEAQDLALKAIEERLAFAKELAEIKVFPGERERTDSQLRDQQGRRSVLDFLVKEAADIQASIFDEENNKRRSGQADSATEKALKARLKANKERQAQLGQAISVADAKLAVSMEEQLLILDSWVKVNGGIIDSNDKLAEPVRAIIRELEDARNTLDEIGLGSSAREVLNIRKKAEESLSGWFDAIQKDLDVALGRARNEGDVDAAYSKAANAADMAVKAFNTLVDKRSEAWLKAFQAKADMDLMDTRRQFGERAEDAEAQLAGQATRVAMIGMEKAARTRAEIELETQERLAELARNVARKIDGINRQIERDFTGPDGKPLEGDALTKARENAAKTISSTEEDAAKQRAEIARAGAMRLQSIEKERFADLKDLYHTALGDILGDVANWQKTLQRLAQQILKQNFDRGIQGWGWGNRLSGSLAGGHVAAQNTYFPETGGTATGSLMESGAGSGSSAPRLTSSEIDLVMTRAQAAKRNFGKEIGGRGTLNQALMMYGIGAQAQAQGSPVGGLLQGAISGFFGSGGNPIFAGIGALAGLFGGLFGHKKPPGPPPEPQRLAQAQDLMWSSPVGMPTTAYLGGRMGGATRVTNIGTMNLAFPSITDAQTAHEAGRAFAAGMMPNARSLTLDAARGAQGRL